MIPAMETSWSPGQRALVEDSGFMVSAATLFPNLSFVHNWPQIDEAGTVAPFISIRQWQPVSERETEVLSWFAVDARRPSRSSGLLPGVPDVLRLFRHVRAGRRGELGLDHGMAAGAWPGGYC